MKSKEFEEFQSEYQEIIAEIREETDLIEGLLGKEVAEHDYGDLYQSLYSARRLLESGRQYALGVRNSLTLEFFGFYLANQHISYKEFIRGVRTEFLKMTQVDFAKFVMKSQQTVSAWEKGSATPALGEYFEIYGKTLERLHETEVIDRDKK